MKHNLTKKDLVLRMCKSTGVSPETAKKALETVLTNIQLSLAHGKHVELRNFGTLEVQVHRSRIGRNPQMPDKAIIIPDRAVVKFRPGQTLKKQLKNINIKDLQMLL